MLLQCPACWRQQYNVIGLPFGSIEEARYFCKKFPLTFKAIEHKCETRGCDKEFAAVVHLVFDGKRVP